MSKFLLIVIAILAILLFHEPLAKWYRHNEAKLDKEYDTGREPLPSDFAFYNSELIKLVKYGKTNPQVPAKPKSESLRPPVKDNQSLRTNFVPANRRVK